mgnify:CR=1 FL=1
MAILRRSDRVDERVLAAVAHGPVDALVFLGISVEARGRDGGHLQHWQALAATRVTSDDEPTSKRRRRRRSADRGLGWREHGLDGLFPAASSHI